MIKSSKIKKFEDLFVKIYKRTPKIDIDSELGILTACDKNIFVGFQLLLLSILISHDIKIVLVDIGLDEDQLNWCKNISNLFVVQLSEILPYNKNDDNWQTWNKPFYICCSPFKKTIWIDSDCIVKGDLNLISQILDKQPLFTPDKYPSCSSNIYNLLPIDDNTQNEKHPYLNAGVIGLNLNRYEDIMVLNKWKEVIKLSKDNKIIQNNLPLHDQSALKWTIDKLGYNKFINNNMFINYLYSGHNQMMPIPFLKLSYSLPGLINHFVSGVVKPWFSWGKFIDLDLGRFDV